MEIFDRVDRVIGAISKYIDYVSRIGFFVMMALVTINVILRYVWKSIPGTYDYVQLITAISVGAAIAYTAYERGNIEIEILMERLPQRVQDVTAAVMMAITLAFSAIAAWQVIVLGRAMSSAGDTTMTAYVPLAPFLYWIAIGLGLMMLVMVVQFIRLVCKAVGR
jgi:TRAP-type C4-dicarboxylate transport system permease small subunit